MWIRPNRLILSLKVTKSEFKNLVMVKAHHYFGFSNCCTILVSIILRDYKWENFSRASAGVQQSKFTSRTITGDETGVHHYK